MELARFLHQGFFKAIFNSSSRFETGERKNKTKNHTNWFAIKKIWDGNYIVIRGHVLSLGYGKEGPLLKDRSPLDRNALLHLCCGVAAAPAGTRWHLLALGGCPKALPERESQGLGTSQPSLATVAGRALRPLG